jgi:Tfp pilus assembly protein PilV
MKDSERTERRTFEKGSSLLEVLIALMIMLFLMIGILQMFSMAYLVNLGSGARTEMTYKCQQLAENMRLLNYLAKNGFAVPSGTGITFPIAAVTSIPENLPYTSSELTNSPYWGPTQSSVVDGPDMPYRLSYQIADGDAGVSPAAPGFWIITVSATPNQATTSRRYLGAGLAHKRVDYVSQMPK